VYKRQGTPNGAIEGGAKIEALQHATAVLCPYQIDAGAHVPLEAMMCGTPVVARAACCMFEYVPTGGGLLCNSPGTMATAIEIAGTLRPAQVRQTAIDAGFTVERLGIEIEDVLQRAANGERW